jgi:hypothetical protein
LAITTMEKPIGISTQSAANSWRSQPWANQCEMLERHPTTPTTSSQSTATLHPTTPPSTSSQIYPPKKKN